MDGGTDGWMDQPMDGPNLLLRCQNASTDDDELQDEEGVKTVAPPPTAHTIKATGACWVAVCSL